MLKIERDTEQRATLITIHLPGVLSLLLAIVLVCVVKDGWPYIMGAWLLGYVAGMV